MADLTAATRNGLSDNEFALPAERKFPVTDRAHAKSALSYAAKSGNPTTIRKVKSKVAAKFPGIGQGSRSTNKPSLKKRG